jgi:RHS repeat-associated protein
MSDMPQAEPGAGIDLIDSPEANATGDARLAYPIAVPAGRSNIQPHLSVDYSSSAANGWMGLGWNLSVPSIMIDTRWGVPRYDAADETETYTFNGTQLTPVAHRGALQPRTAEKIFHARVEEFFQKIIRHGTTPANYWWEVVDKDGARSFFGGDPQTNGPAADATLVDGGGNIFAWGLREIRDANGNGITYRYVRVADPGIVGGSVPGSQLYLKSINYTRSNGAAGAYTVTFYRDSELPSLPNFTDSPSYRRRSDASIDARGGFKMVTADLLRRIDVTFDSSLIRRYDFLYQEGAFKKTLLHSVTQSGENGVAFNTHTFTYYDEVRQANGAYQGFGSSTNWTTASDGVRAPRVPLSGQASALGGAVTDAAGGHLYVGFNLDEPTKEGSGGGSVGFNHSSTDTVLAMLDLNGDGLPDKVFKGSGGQVSFRLNRSGPNGTSVFGPPVALPSLSALGQETATTFSAGPELYLGANVMYNHAETFTTSSVYFSDVNGDGLPDLVNGSQVSFNHLAGGVPTFTSNSSDTPVPIGPGAVDATEIISNYEPLYQQAIDQSPLLDSLRRWVAPYDGQIQISGSAALIQDTSPARSQYQTADGVRLAIQQNGGELWSAQVGPNDYSPKTPSGVNALNVHAGDRIYFRVQSLFDGSYDQVAWNPQISYRNVQPAVDVNGLNPYVYQAADDFTLAGRRDMSVTVPLTGTLRIEGALHKLGQTTDDVTLLVFKNGTATLSQTLAWNQIGDFNLPPDFAVLKGDNIQLRVKVDSPIDLRQLRWAPNLFYVATDPPQPITDASGSYLFQLHPPYDIDLYPATNLTAPQQSWAVTQTATLTVVPHLTALPGNTNGNVTFTVKRQGALLAKRMITISNGVVPNAQFDVGVTQGDQLFFDFSVYDPQLAARLSNPSVAVVYGDPSQKPTTPVPSALHSAVVPGLFAEPYRGWTYVGYNGNRDRATQPINESLLTLSSVVPPRNPDGSVNYDNYNPTSSATAYLFTPFPEQSRWRGPVELAWVGGDQISSSRQGAPYIAVPRADAFAGARAVARLSRTSQDTISGGVGPLSASYSTGSSYGEVDELDMNGDGFPDIVGKGRIQYTTAVGGLEAHNRTISGLDHTLDTQDQARNIGIGGNAATFKANASGEVDASGRGAPKGNVTGSQMALLGFSGSLGDGSSDIQTSLLDLNGDGLPDRVVRRGSQLWVALNQGYDFGPQELWADGAINTGSSQNFSIGAGLGFNGGIYDFAGGASLDESDSQNQQTLADINGDELPDLIAWTGQGFRVALNTGNGFAPQVSWGGALPHGLDTNATVGLGGGAFFTIGIGPLCLPAPLCYVIINPGGDGSQSIARPETQLTDVDGDGNLDHIYSTGDGSMVVAQSQVGRTNLLQSVQRPLGASMTLAYQRDGNTYAMPHSRWVLSRVALNDGVAGDGVDTQVTTYRYEQGRYNRLEREFYGYARVTEEERDASNGDALYRATIREYANDSYYTHELLTRMLVQDAAGHPFDETVDSYALVDVATGLAGDPQSTTAAQFPQLVRTDERFYEGNAAPGKQTYTTYKYDALGNITQVFDAADVGAQDDIQTDTTYAACPASYIMGTANRVIVSSNGTELRHREGTVDCATGDVTQLRQYFANGDAAVIDLAYLPNGNVQQVTNPANQNGQRYQLTYEYDPAVQTYITKTTDSFGYVSTATYNLKYGELATALDTNSNPTSYAYDAFGRLISVSGPYEQAGATPTLRFEYHPEAAVPWAITRQLDSSRGPSATIDSVIFTDGLGRTVQTKQSGTVFTGPDSAPQDVMVVSGRSTLDFVGRPVAMYYPVTEPLGSAGSFNPTYDAVQPTRTTYDILDRVARVSLPDNTFTTNTYRFGADRDGATQFETTITNANGVPKKIYTDVHDQIVGVEEFNQGGSQVIWTSYEYDPLDQLTGVVDDKHNVTSSTYDNLGRRTSLASPDAGTTTWSYDLDSNIVATITANLRAEGRQIGYAYDFNRLKRISYPDFPGNNVTYSYGGPGAADNRAGRISQITDESGTTQRFYDQLGDISREIKTISSATGGAPAAYITQYLYDTWGRLQSMTYPDGEVLTYQYDSGGLVRKAVGVKGTFSYQYVNRLEYDKFGERAFVEAGNGVRTSYTYDPKNHLMASLKTGKANTAPFQNLAYTYDPAGNILSQTNNVAIPPASQPGGPTNTTFRYDDLDRLVGATGSYRYESNKQRQYSLSMAYDTIHNLVSKQQTDQIVQPSGNGIIQQPTTYSFAYRYGGTQPHAPAYIGARAYTYDADGNQTSWTSDQSGTHRSIVWDEENRIQSISENGQPLTYTYNEAGERVTKRGPQGETVYVNPYFTIRSGTDGTKHIYAGGVRVVSKLVKSSAQEKDQYYFHDDNLGSTNYVTDASGAIYEHLEYFPSGETWIDESSNTQRTPYLFTGKELDEETGLYYFGARYYDPRTGMWQSADPILNDYVDGAPNGGVYDSRNNNLYSYARLSPTNYTDPDGLTHKPDHVKRQVRVEKEKRRRKELGLDYRGAPKRIRLTTKRYEPGEGGEARTEVHTFGKEFGGATRTVLNPRGQYFKQVKISYQGTRAKDFALANSLVGYKKTPKGFVWHHFHDYNSYTGKGTLYLMTEEAHSPTHTGGVWMYKKAHKVKDY